MTLFQLLLLLVAGSIFYLFFKQLFGGNYPKRGVDFESDLQGSEAGGITDPGKIFAKHAVPPSRVEELLSMADEAAENGDWVEVKKAMNSAILIDGNNPDVMHRLGTSYLQMNDFANAKMIYEKLLGIVPDDDMAEVALANALHKLGEDDAAIVHHERALVLDASYAPHYYNYANTLYDLGQKERALELYKKALEIDPEMQAAKYAIEELENE